MITFGGPFWCNFIRNLVKSVKQITPAISQELIVFVVSEKCILYINKRSIL
jgi:hypothetical protein